VKHVTQNYKNGEIKVRDTDVPALRRGGVLVRSLFSLISTGTEGMKAREGKMSYLQKAKARPDQVKKVLDSVQQQGVKAVYHKVMNKLDSLTPLGYSLAGEVVGVGEDTSGLSVGQLVACAGAGYANHAEVNFIPSNLVVPIPDGVDPKHAAFTTVGAIAMQGYRQSDMQLGETACVIGLGLIGQLLLQILRAAGVHVVGVDLSRERNNAAVELGADAAFEPSDPALRTTLRSMTGGAGADCIFICAGGTSNAPVELAVELARDRARVVDIGKTRLDLAWNAYYEKELDVRFSRSYGPGRYDPTYEERGIDYPIGYVRWTERRNMASFLDLVAQGRVVLDSIISGVFPIDEAEHVYQDLVGTGDMGTGVLFEYAAQDKPQVEAKRGPVGKTAAERPSGKARIGAIGAGNYASSMLFPHLAKHKDACLVEVATATPLSGANAARKFGFERTGTDYRKLLEASDLDAVIIATRHASHPAFTDEALRSGRAVFVEKPLAIDFDGLEKVRRAVVESGNDRLQVGFNRRFSPTVRALAEAFESCKGPLVMHYRVHAGQMDAGSWYMDRTEGSRFAGEAGHFLDVFAFLTGASPVSVYATSLRPDTASPDDADNVMVMVNYDDGSVGTLFYITQGGTKLPKEYIEIHGGGRTGQLHNFESVVLFEGLKRRKIRGGRLDKGQKDQMAAFVQAVKSGEQMPIPFQSLLDTTLVTLAAEESMRRGQAVSLDSLWG
jgi:predicted dehydrogenase